MFGLGKVFRRSGKALKNSVNLDALQAAVAAGVYVASSDGSFSKPERMSLENQIRKQDSLKSFGQKDVAALIDRFAGLLEDNVRLGRKKLLKECEDIASNPDLADDVFLLAYGIADNDGVSKDEAKALLEVAVALGVETRSGYPELHEKAAA